jgi:hypothetical protein
MIQLIPQVLVQFDSSYFRVVRILTRISRSGRLNALCAIVGRRIRCKTLMRHQPFVDVFADWASKSNANETGPPMCADAAIKLAAADGTLKSKRIRSDLLQSLAFPAIGAPLMAPIEIPAIQWNGEWPRSMPHRPRPRYAPNAPPAWREAQNLNDGRGVIRRASSLDAGEGRRGMAAAALARVGDR